MLELTDGIKFITVFISVFVSVFAVRYQINKTRQIRAELLKLLDDAIKTGSKHSVCELFRMIYGLKMSYSDICKLTNDENSVKIIYALKRSPEMVLFSNGEFRFHDNYEKSWIFKIDRAYRATAIYVLAIAGLYFSITLLFTSGMAFFRSLMLLIFSIVCFSFLIASTSHDKWIKKLVESTK